MELQKALKELFYSLGGNADAVRNTDDVTAILAAIAALAIGDQLKGAVELPAFPEDDGTYALQLVMDDGAATLTWESAE